jgi:copper(I)-binding protein
MKAKIAAAMPAVCLAGFAALFSPLALAQVDVSNAWARGTVPAQTATGVFMTLHAHAPAKLVGVSTPAAATAEVHEMKMENNVMRMRAVDGIELPAMKDVELKPGGYHVMLSGLKAPLKAGDVVPVTLTIEQGGKRTQQLVKAEVRGLTAAGHGPAAGGAQHKH